MRRTLLGMSLLALSACAQQNVSDRIFPVFFDGYSSNLDSTAMSIVSNAAAAAKRYPAFPVRVTGYADRAGTPQREIELSRARADAVAALLQQDGVDPGRVTRSAVGTPPNSEPGVERRRVEILLDAP